MIERIANFVDKSIIAGANYAVRAYNWATGGTKADLANTLLGVAPAIETTSVATQNLECSAIAAPWFLFLSHAIQIKNRDLEERESLANNNQLIDPEVYQDKKNIKRLGYLWFASGILSFPPILQGINESTIDDYGRFVAWSAIRAPSQFIMLADDLPPRKNCLRRGLDRLTDIIEKYRSPSPATA